MAEEGNDNFILVSFNDSEALGKTRKLVRSRAAQYSHRIAPRPTSKIFKQQQQQQRQIKNEKSNSPSSTNSHPSPVGSQTQSSSPESINDTVDHTTNDAGTTNLASTDTGVCDDSTAKHQTSEQPSQKRSRFSTPNPALHVTANRPQRKKPNRIPSQSGLQQKQLAPRPPRPPVSFTWQVALREQHHPAASDRLKAAAEDDNDDKAHLILNPDVAALLRTPLDSGRGDPFNALPGVQIPLFDWLFDFWYKGVLPRAQNLIKTSQQEMESYTVWSRQQEVSEPALYYITLFLASGIPVSQGKVPLDVAIWLRGQAVKELQEAVHDPKRATNNAVILAVGRVALHEHIYGDRNLSHQVHRPAQQRMIAMRGGIEALGLPTPTVQMMVWYDSLMAAESGTQAYFSHDMPSLSRMGIASFRPDEAISVTSISSPNRYQHPGYALPANTIPTNALPAYESTD